MTYRTNQVRWVSFSRQHFIDEVLLAAGALPTSKPSGQAEYIAKYLDDDLKAQSLVVEPHYIDRHFIEEFSAYYGRCLTPIPNACARLHAFAAEPAVLEGLFRRAASGDFASAREELQRVYLGFSVVRPLPSAPIGRTVLRYPRDLEQRKYESTARYDAHLLGFDLIVHGIAFQQQDVAVAACATTAVWTALQRMARHEGDRAPTPSAITQAAVRYVVHDGRPLPGRGGLRTDQVSEALRAFDFGPEIIEVGKDPDGFRILLGVYLRSGIPAILSVVDSSTGALRGHAVTAVGYREALGKAAPEDPSPTQATLKLTVFDETGLDQERVAISYRNTAYDRLFIHDDRLGPYASARLVSGTQGLELQIKWPNEYVETLLVRHATIPLYPKLRSSAQDLVLNAFDLIPSVRRGSAVSLELYFTRSGSYTSSLYGKGLDAERLLNFQRAASLSRYVGIARWYVDGTPVLDTVWDTTDIRRKNRSDKTEGLLAIIALDASYEGFVDRCAEDYGVIVG